MKQLIWTILSCITLTFLMSWWFWSTFYQTAFLLEQIAYRIDENPNRNIMLQAYIDFPFGMVWRHSSLMWLISILWLLLLGGILGGYNFWRRRMCRIAEQQMLLQQYEFEQLELHRQQKKLQEKQQQLLEKKEQLPSLFTQNKTIKWLELSEGLLFDEEHGDLCFRNEVNLRLTENSLRLFRCFTKAEQQKLTYEKICMDVLMRSIKDGLSKTDRDAVTNAIRHLRIHLKPIPVIRIESMRGTGYQMIILTPEDSVK